MLRPLSGRQPKHRRFEYQPRFYDPSKDEGERLKRRMRAGKTSATGKRTRQPAFIAVGLGLLLALYLYLNIDTIVERVASFSGFFFSS